MSIVDNIISEFSSNNNINCNIGSDIIKQYSTININDEKQLKELDQELLLHSFIGNNNSLTILDIIVYGLINSKFPFNSYINISRWYDYIQHQIIIKTAKFNQNKAIINIQKPVSSIFSLDLSAGLNSVNTNITNKPSSNNITEHKPASNNIQPNTNNNNKEKTNELKTDSAQVSKEKKESKESDSVIQVYRCDFRVGKIIKAVPHPKDPKCVVSNIDFGEGKTREVISGIADYYKPDQLTNLLVVGLLNLKPADIKGIISGGRLMVASSSDGSKKELVEAPVSSLIGERISFVGVPVDKYDAELASKNQHKIFKELKTNSKCEACYAELTFNTKAGPCTVKTISNGTVA